MITPETILLQGLIILMSLTISILVIVRLYRRIRGIEQDVKDVYKENTAVFPKERDDK